MNPTEPGQPAPAPQTEAPDDMKAMLIGAACIFVIAFIPYSGFLCCLPQIFAAALAIHLFTGKYRLTLTTGEGIKLGILTTLSGGMAAWAIAVALMMLFGYQVGHEIIDLMPKMFEHSNPEVAQKMREQFEAKKAAGIQLTDVLIGLCANVVSAGISGLIGGALGAVMFKRGPARTDNN
jgi:hypothetical protein